VDQPLEVVLCFGGVLPPLVLQRAILRRAHRRLRADSDRLPVVRQLVLCSHPQRLILIESKDHVDLRRPARPRWQPDQVRSAQKVVAARYRVPALEDLRADLFLAILGRHEGLRASRAIIREGEG
jgi:hypothetical protein